jgi:hypothetical protein
MRSLVVVAWAATVVFLALARAWSNFFPNLTLSWVAVFFSLVW